MRKKNGFTLVELLAVLVILSFILIATVPAVSGILSRNRQRLYRDQVDTILRVSKDWALKNSDLLPSDGNTYYLTLGELAAEGLIESDEIYDPRTEERMRGCVLIENSANKYTYSYEEKECSEFTENLLPVIEVVGGANQETEINEPYQLPAVTAHSASGKVLSVGEPEIRTNGSVVSSVTTTQLNQVYSITYSAVDDETGYERKYTMTLTVVDTTKPVISVMNYTESTTIEVNRNSNFQIPTATVTDNSGETIQAEVDGSVNTSKADTYELTYMATDSSGNTSVLILTVVVK